MRPKLPEIWEAWAQHVAVCLECQRQPSQRLCAEGQALLVVLVPADARLKVV